MNCILFNEGWKFWEVTNSFALAWAAPADARVVDLPHDAMIEKPQDENCRSKGNTGYRSGGVYSYSKNIFAESSDKTYILKIEGAYMNAFVYVNGQLAAKRPYGYTVFYVELNNYLKFHAENEIRISVRTGAEPNSRWYSGSGIYRDVYLLEAGKTYIVPDSVKIKPLINSCDGFCKAEIFVSAEIKGAFEGCSLEVTIKDAKGNTAAEKVYTISNAAVCVSSEIEKADLWDAENPNLYSCEIKLMKDGSVLDRHVDSFGIRSLELSSKKGLLVNGKEVKLRGACIHHDSGMIGAKTFEDVHIRQLKIMKESGFNAIRCSHNPAAPALLRACDKVGMYVMDEAFDMWTRFKSDYDYAQFFDEWWERDIEAMVKNDYNHPSVIMYSVGNEIPETCNMEGVKICKKLCDKVKSLDDTRYTTNSINGVFSVGDRMKDIIADIASGLKAEGKMDGNVNDFMFFMGNYMSDMVKHPIMGEVLEAPFEHTDVAGYNYMGSRYEGDSEKYPERVIVGSETSICEIAMNWNLVKKLSNVIGDFCWTGWDYLGEAGIGVPAYAEEGTFGLGNGIYPTQISGTGCIDITGFRMPMSYYREIVFGLRKDPYIAVADPEKIGKTFIRNPWTFSDAIGSWSWDKYKGKKLSIEVYSGSDEVELYLNGISLGRKPAGEKVNFTTVFEAEYEPGTLTAVAYTDGEESGSFMLSSPSADVKLTAEEEFRFTDKGSEIIYINIAFTDENGIVAADMDQLLSLELSDGLELMAFGSAEPKPYNNYLEATARTYRGRAQLIIRKTSAAASSVTIFSDSENCVALNC